MRRLSWAAFILLVPFLLQMTTGCGGGKSGKSQSSSGQAQGTEPEEGEVKKTELKSTGAGTLKGKVTFEGGKPASFGKELSDFVNLTKKECESTPPNERIDPTWVISKAGGVKNVVVFVKPPENTYFRLSDKDKKPAEDKVVLHQPHCAFIPHVFALYPSYFDGKEEQPTGQKLEIVNDANFAHNTDYEGLRGVNPSRNFQLPAGDKKLVVLKPQDAPVTFKCDIHQWMRGKAWVFDHPFYAITDDEGRYEIKNVPAGADIYLVAWHEGLPSGGFVNGTPEGQKISLKDGDTLTKDFKVAAK
jgi:hypothetical protein